MNWYKKTFASRTIWKPDQGTIELIKKMYNPELGAEHSIARVARTIGANPKTLTRWLKKNNLYQEVGSYDTGWKPKDESESNLIKQLYLLPPEGQGKSLGQISKITNIPAHNLRTWLKNQKLYRYSNKSNTFNPSEEMKEKIKKWYILPPEGDGLGVKTIAKKIGVSANVLKRWLIMEGIELRNPIEQRNTPYQAENAKKKLQEWGKTQRLLSENDVDYLVSLYNEGYSTLDIAEAFGIHTVTVWEYLQRRNVKTRTSPEATRLEKSRQKSREDALKYWETRDFWERMATFPLEKRYNIIAGMATKKYFTNDLEKSDWIGRMMTKARSIGDNPKNPHSTPTVHAPYARGNEVEGNVISSINLNWYKTAQVNTISLQEAINRNMFGPVYHGTSPENRQKINEEGFQIFVGENGTEGLSHGYENYEYNYGTSSPPPVHHLGYGIYFTTVKNIAKQFNYGSGRGLETYYLDVPRLETINFGSTNTMMKWWIKNGYDAELAKKNRVMATIGLTTNLRSLYDAVWFKGKGLRRLLDGDQICVYDPSKVYKIDKNLSQSGDIGSKVRRKSDGMKGSILDRRKIPPELSQKYHNGEPELLTIRWTKGGTDYNVYPSTVDMV